jgi:HEAT repeat protein
LKAAAEDNDYVVRDVAFQVLPKFLAPDAAEHAAPALLRMAATNIQWRQKAGRVLSRLNSKAAGQALPVLLRSAAEDLDPEVRWAALHYLPKQLSPEAVALLVASGTTNWKPLLRWWLRWRHVRSPLTADKLMREEGLRPGPELGERLRQLRFTALDR